MLDLTGKVALITGAARGQGAAEAELFARHGARVVLADILDAEGQTRAAEIAGAEYLHLDVSSEQQWQAAVQRTLSRFGRLDILVNNAAALGVGSIEETSLQDFMRMQSINLAGVFLGMKTAVSALKANGGAIVNVSSIAGIRGRANLAAYGASKWGVRGLTQSAALEFGRYGVRVNLIVPGLIDTDMTRGRYGLEKVRDRGLTLPVGRHGESLDVARLALFLVAAESGFCTGAEFVCDGGETVGWL
ncbi:SDR family NAD(P)-dependent oxidoreductase [Peristeroidobacter soli]|jgi:3alpha(or 20beta)-hydroxysteroid dehydrogenase|uniref:SDR family NAD(P)-dependent oxidoreductase n=1 Tax=Peristeroidobacter soli TaxID=2497877 RepID=UPI00101B5F32|nr:SDR family oxidoreductase [Peristeroidobacter soli]